MTHLTTRSSINTLIKRLRVERTTALAEARANPDDAAKAKRLRQIDFIGKSINALVAADMAQ